MTGVDTHHVSDISLYCCNKLPDLGNLKAHWRLGLWQPTYSDNGWNVQLSIRNTFIIGKHHRNIEQTLKKRNELRQETSGRFAVEDSEDMSQKRVPLTTWLQEACTGHVSARIGTWHVGAGLKYWNHDTTSIIFHPETGAPFCAGDGRWCWYEWPLGAGPFSVAWSKKIGQQMFGNKSWSCILIQTDS